MWNALVDHILYTAFKCPFYFCIAAFLGIFFWPNIAIVLHRKGNTRMHYEKLSLKDGRQTQIEFLDIINILLINYSLECIDKR